MDKFKLLDELVKALELTPQEVVRHWNNTGKVKSALFSRSQAKSSSKQSKRASKSKSAGMPSAIEVETFVAIRKIISELIDVDEDDITRESCLVVDLGADSLDFAELKMSIEKHFGIVIPDEDIKGKETVQEFVDYLVSRKI